MNKFEQMADNYRILIERNKISKEDGEAEIRVLEFLASCSKEDFHRMINSSAFNDVIVNFCRKALDLAEISVDDKARVIDAIHHCCDFYSCREICDEYK